LEKGIHIFRFAKYDVYAYELSYFRRANIGQEYRNDAEERQPRADMEDKLNTRLIR